MRRPHSRGFTLLEVLIAVAVLAIILTIIYRSYWLCSKNVAQAQEHSDLYQSARLALRRISDDLMCAYVPLANPEEGEKPPEAAPPPEEGGEQGAEGAAAASTQAFRAYDVGTGEAARDVLEFVSLANLSRRASAQIEPCELRYSVEEAGEGEGRLMRTSTSGSGDPETFELAPNVKGLDLKFYGAEGDETADWDSARDGKLPVMVEITLYMGRGEEEPVVFTTAVNIPLAWEREALGRGVAELATEEKKKAEEKAKDKAKAKAKEGGATEADKTGGPKPGPGDTGDDGGDEDGGDDDEEE